MRTLTAKNIKELEVGMLEGKADIAVHSMKDVPYEIPKDFELGAILKRENPFDDMPCLPKC
jgi:hydroxymethylbilane synthase